MLAVGTASVRERYRTALVLPVARIATAISAGADLRVFVRAIAPSRAPGEVALKLASPHAADTMARHVLRATGELPEDGVEDDLDFA
jgi:hypothetical protein